MARRQRKQKELKDEAFIDRDEEGVEEEVDSPPSIDPYAVLGLGTEATADEVKKAYRKLALKHHPDKAKEDDKTAANKTFQEIAFAYAILSDDRRRKRYDLTGSTAETMEDDADFDWLQFYRRQFAELVTEESVKRVSREYKGTAEERKDLLDAYTRFKGRFAALYECVMLSDILEDDDRFRQILDEEIANGTIESYPAYERDNNDDAREKAKAAERKRREDFDKRHSKDAKNGKANGKANSKKDDVSDMSSLAALIQRKQRAQPGNFLDHLEAKYAPKSRGKKRAVQDEPPEEMFQAAEERAKKRKQERNGRATKPKEPSEEEIDEMLEEEDIEESEEEEEETPPPKAKKRGRLLKAPRRGRATART